MIEPRPKMDLPPWTEDAWDRWFYSFMKEVTSSEGDEQATEGSSEATPGGSPGGAE